MSMPNHRQLGVAQQRQWQDMAVETSVSDLENVLASKQQQGIAKEINK